jgi:hypothetical protein
MRNLFTYERKTSLRRGLAKILIAFTALWILPMATATAAPITPRKVTLSTSAISTSATHTFNFTIPTTGNVGSIKFLYCTTASGGCSTPAGLTTTSASLSAQSGETGFSIVNATNGAPYITRTVSSVTGPQAVSYSLATITNPSTVNTSFFIRITTYASTDTSGGSTDAGVVAASTASQITVNAQVDEILTFCVYTGANCAAAGSTVDLGVLTPSTTGTGVSYMDAGTNAGSGFVITYFGPTLTSGARTVTAIGGTASPSTVGLAQFGINATGANTAPAVAGSQAPSGVAPIGSASTNYDTADQYAFVPSVATNIANATSSANTTKYSVSYISNINSSQAAGSYTTTLTYVCTGTF